MLNADWSDRWEGKGVTVHFRSKRQPAGGEVAYQGGGGIVLRHGEGLAFIPWSAIDIITGPEVEDDSTG